MDGGEVIQQDIETKGLSEGISLDRNEWRKLIHLPDLAWFSFVHVAYPKYSGQMALLLLFVMIYA